jgi:RNA polymerase sigma-70 factor (ECF subfamily)
VNDRTLIRQAMARLPQPHRVLIYRAHFLKHTTAQIAVDLDVPEYIVRAELHDAMQELRRVLIDVRTAV